MAVAEPAPHPAERRCGPHEEGSVEEELQHDVPHRRLAVEPARVDRAPALGEREQDGREVAPDPGAERGVLVEEGQERRQAEVAGRRRGAEGADDRLVEEGAERAVGREVEERRRHHERGAPRERERAPDLARALGREQDGQAERRAHAEAVVLLAEDGRADARARAEGVGAEHEHDRPCEEGRRERGVAHDLPVREGPDAVAEEEPCEAERPGARHDGARGAEEEGRERGERAHREQTRGPDRRARRPEPRGDQVERARERIVDVHVAVEELPARDLLGEGQQVALVEEGEVAVVDRELDGDGREGDTEGRERFAAVPHRTAS